jgi:hypothetical protein
LKNTFSILLGFHTGTRILGICKGFAKVLGHEKNVITYVDNIFLYSPGFEDHLATLDSILHKFTSKGFAINASKYPFCRPQIRSNSLVNVRFCRPEIKFLSYISATTFYIQARRESKPFFRTLGQETRKKDTVSALW